MSRIVGDRRDFTVYPKSRIARLPRPLQWPAVLVRNAVKPVPKLAYVYESDGLATAHYTPFLEDESEFDRLYWEMERDWQTYTADYRWRFWMLTRFARRAAKLEGNFVEFGTYRGGCAWMILQTADLRPEAKFHLFDTFGGLPDSQLTERERREQFAGRFPDTSPAYVEELLEPWKSQVELHVGDVFETTSTDETGPLAFAHLDLNAAEPTRAALEYIESRLVAGFTIVFDDYGQFDYPDQRRIVDEFFAERPQEVFALPTGQGVVIDSR